MEAWEAPPRRAPRLIKARAQALKLEKKEVGQKRPRRAKKVVQGKFCFLCHKLAI